MTMIVSVGLKQPRFATSKAKLIAGHAKTYSFGNMAGSPAQWQNFVPNLRHISGQTWDSA